MKTCFTNIKFIRNKECSTIAASFKNYMAWLLQQKNANVKRTRNDNGGEYTGKKFQDIYAESSIIHETTSPHTPEHKASPRDLTEYSKKQPLPFDTTLNYLADFGYWPSTQSTSSKLDSSLTFGHVTPPSLQGNETQD